MIIREVPKVGSETPWGAADWINQVTEDGGILFVGTPSHGGYWLSSERLAKMPSELRKFGTKSPYHPDWEGWFEEDCEWGAVALAFPEEFTTHSTRVARTMVDGMEWGGHYSRLEPLSLYHPIRER